MAQYYKWRGGQNQYPYAPYDLERETKRADWEAGTAKREEQNARKYRTREEMLAAKAKKERDRKAKLPPEVLEAEYARKRRQRHEKRAKELGVTVEEYLATHQQYGVKAA